jgi:hypothetical protein
MATIRRYALQHIKANRCHTSSWRDGLPSDAADCGLSGMESCPRWGDSCSEGGPQFPLIAGPTHLDCGPLQLYANPQTLKGPRRMLVVGLFLCSVIRLNIFSKTSSKSHVSVDTLFPVWVFQRIQ